MTVVVEQTAPTAIHESPRETLAPWHVRVSAFAVDVLPGLAVIITMALVLRTVSAHAVSIGRSGAGSAFRSILPFGFNGNDSSATHAVGTMYSGRSRWRIAPSSACATAPALSATT